MNYCRRLLLFFISDNTGVRELAPYPTDKKTKAWKSGMEKKKKIFWTTGETERSALKPKRRCRFYDRSGNSIIRA